MELCIPVGTHFLDAYCYTERLQFTCYTSILHSDLKHIIKHIGQLLYTPFRKNKYSGYSSPIVLSEKAMLAVDLTVSKEKEISCFLFAEKGAFRRSYPNILKNGDVALEFHLKKTLVFNPYTFMDFFTLFEITESGSLTEMSILPQHYLERIKEYEIPDDLGKYLPKDFMNESLSSFSKHILVYFVLIYKVNSKTLP
jgi:hypothetical protein